MFVYNKENLSKLERLNFRKYRAHIKELIKLAESNDANAQFELGMEYIYSKFLKKDIAKAMELLQAALNSGIEEAKDHIITKENAVEKANYAVDCGNKELEDYININFLSN